MNRLHALLLGVLMSVSFSSVATTPPPTPPFDTITWKATMKHRPSTGLQMGTFRIQFEKTTLDEIRRSAAIGEIAHAGDAGESTYWLCYTNLGITQTETERIWIAAHGEMGGREHYVTSVSAQLVPGSDATADCPALPKNLQPVSLDNQLWLGVSEGAVFSKLGAPSYKKDGWQSFDFQGKVQGQCEGGGFDLTAWLLLHLQDGRIHSLRVGQVTSC